MESSDALRGANHIPWNFKGPVLVVLSFEKRKNPFYLPRISHFVTYEVFTDNLYVSICKCRLQQNRTTWTHTMHYWIYCTYKERITETKQHLFFWLQLMFYYPVPAVQQTPHVPEQAPGHPRHSMQLTIAVIILHRFRALINMNMSSLPTTMTEPIG